MDKDKSGREQDGGRMEFGRGGSGGDRSVHLQCLSKTDQRSIVRGFSQICFHSVDAKSKTEAEIHKQMLRPRLLPLQTRLFCKTWKPKTRKLNLLNRSSYQLQNKTMRAVKGAVG